MKSMKMSDGGRVVVPAEIRKALNLREGDTVYWELLDGEARLTTRMARLRRAQEAVKRYTEAGTGSVVEELLADRRREEL